jgi:transcriptional regulator with XRE-family HTH domain
MLNKNITRLRKSKGLTQVDFAKQLHVTQSAVSHWESGRSIPDTVQLFRIAEFFGVTVEELSQMKEQEPPTVTREGPIEVVRFDGTKKDGKSNVLAAIFAELETMSEEDLKVALQHAKFLKSQRKEEK